MRVEIEQADGGMHVEMETIDPVRELLRFRRKSFFSLIPISIIPTGVTEWTLQTLHLES